MHPPTTYHSPRVITQDDNRGDETTVAIVASSNCESFFPPPIHCNAITAFVASNGKSVGVVPFAGSVDVRTVVNQHFYNLFVDPKLRLHEALCASSVVRRYACRLRAEAYEQRMSNLQPLAAGSGSPPIVALRPRREHARNADFLRVSSFTERFRVDCDQPPEIRSCLIQRSAAYLARGKTDSQSLVVHSSASKRSRYTRQQLASVSCDSWSCRL